MQFNFKIILTLFFIFFLSGYFSNAQQRAFISIGDDDQQPRIDKNIYGMFSEQMGKGIYDGFWVGVGSDIPNIGGIRTDLIEAFKKIRIPILRWPGGCFADGYHWKDGIGPKETRPTTINSNWGMVSETNDFGLHEFMNLCDLLGAKAYLAGNVGSGTVEEMSQWVEYMNSPLESSISRLRKANGRKDPWGVQYWGVGNESWGCGGRMTPEFYSDLFRQYATFLKSFPGTPIRRIASGPEGNKNDLNWMEIVMKNIPYDLMWGVGLHYYAIPKGTWSSDMGSATNFTEEEYFESMKNALDIEKELSEQIAVMDKFDPEKKVALVMDEWGVWTNSEQGTPRGFLYQQNSLRDALIAGTTLNIFNNHSDRIKMATLAQTVNVLQALALTEGKEMLLTPTYYVFDMYKNHQDAKLLPTKVVSPDYKIGNSKLNSINVSASLDSTGKVLISLVNLDPRNSIKTQISTMIKGWKSIKGEILTSDHFTDYNTFENNQKVKSTSFKGYDKKGDDIIVDIPALSIVVLELE